MLEAKRQMIPQEVMLARLAQSEQMREFFIQMWKQNPVLAKQGGAKVASLLSEAPQPVSKVRVEKQRGTSLIELIMFIVIVSVALAGILLVMNTTTKGSADPLLRKQALAAAYSLLEEVELQDFVPASGVTTTRVAQANRASAYHIVNDYNGFATSGIFPVADSASASAVVPNYNASVAVIPAALGAIAAGSAVQIDVTVTAPNGEAITATGYRAEY